MAQLHKTQGRLLFPSSPVMHELYNDLFEQEERFTYFHLWSRLYSQSDSSWQHLQYVEHL